MAIAELGQRETRRKRLMTRVVIGGLAATALTVGVAYWVGVLRRPQPLPVPQSLPTDVHQQLSGYTFTRSDGGRRIFTVHAARTVAFQQGGSTVLEDVVVELFGRAGNRHDILRTRRCDYNTVSGDLFSSGPVQIELNAQADALPGTGLRGKQRVYLETSKVAFQHQGSLVVTEQPVRFRIGPASGTARGMAYGTKDGWMELKKDVAMELRPRGGAVPLPALQLTASRLRYDKASAEVRLWGPVEVSQGTRQGVAEQGTVWLDSRNRITRVLLEGDVKARDSAPGRTFEVEAQNVEGNIDPASGELRHLAAQGNVRGESKGEGTVVSHLTAQRVDLDFAGSPPKPRSGQASGNAELTLDSSPALAPGDAPVAGAGPERKHLTAAQIDFAFHADGKSIQAAETRGPGKLTIVPVDPKVGPRVITAGQFQMAFDARGHIKTLKGSSPTRIVFQPPANAPPGSSAQESSADRLEAFFDPTTQTLRDVRQLGNFQFYDGDRRASSQEAHYAAPTQGLTLLGRPQVWDANSRVKSERVTFDLHNDTAVGEGKVQATQLRSGETTADGPPAEPTHILSDRMVAQKRSQVIHYEGHVRAWHGSDVVESSALDVYRTERRLSSGSRVLTSHLQPAALMAGAVASGATSRETRPVTIRADALEYFDEGRKAVYRGKVQLQTENTTLHADRLDVYFSNPGAVENAEVERAVAQGHVEVVQPGRHAKGGHGEYFAGPGKIILTVGPPTLEDAQKGFITGQRLTFFVRDDRLLVDGGDESPSLSKHRVAQ